MDTLFTRFEMGEHKFEPKMAVLVFSDKNFQEHNPRK